jgi:drug/metabolite transporter (DMT)-like permease
VSHGKLPDSPDGSPASAAHALTKSFTEGIVLMPNRPVAATLKGIALMALAMLIIPMVDGIAKHLSAAHSPLYISWARYVMACAVVLPFAIRNHGLRCLPQAQLATHTLRTLLLVVGMTCYFLAIARVPLASAASAYFVGPIIAMVLAVMFLREVLSWRKVASLILGFAGTLIVLRPSAGIEPGLWWAFASGVLIALYLIATRLAAQHTEPLRTLAFQCVVGAVLLTPQAVWSWSLPRLAELWIFVALGVLSAASHILSITALRYAQASTLAPLIYLELLGATLIGYFVFDEVPDAHVWFGAAAIVVGGVLLLSASGSVPRDARARE